MARKNELVMNGNPLIPGVVKVSEGYNFTVQVPEGAEASLLLYKKKGKVPVKEISLTDEYKSGEICSILLPEFQAEKFEYNYRIDGKVVTDVHAKRICGRDVFGQIPTGEDLHEIRGGFLTEKEFDWEGDRHPQIPYEEMILYKLHVRGFTKLANIPAKVKGTYAGIKAMIPYMKELGINAVELMPAYEFAEYSVPEKQSGLVREKNENVNVNINYWGYLPGYYFAPKKAYCATEIPENEVRNLVKALHQAGIECIMEMYFPKEINSMLVLQVLQFWKMFYHVDGFHLLGEGVPKQVILQDGILKGTKIMADWFSKEDLRSVSGKSRVLADYNRKFLESMRSLLKSDAGVAAEAAKALRTNDSQKAVVNFMANQDGFTMNDMVSYNEKHNEANGHGNTDGNSYDFSWNCGEEGDTEKKSVLEFREKQLRNAFMMLFLSQGVPMLYAGDEFRNSQTGNNNAYCQDNPTGWVEWEELKNHKDLFEFVKEVISFRKKHPVLHMPVEMKGIDYLMKGLPDLSFHGTSAWECKFEDYNRSFGAMYCGAYAKCEDGTSDDSIYIGYNFHWGSLELALPNPGNGKKWKKTADTAEKINDRYFGESEEVFEQKIEIGPRTIVVLTAK